MTTLSILWFYVSLYFQGFKNITLEIRFLKAVILKKIYYIILADVI